MRVHQEQSIWIDEFTQDENLEAIGIFEGTLNLNNEVGTDMVFLAIGQKQIGFIDKLDLVAVAERIIELWKPKVEVERKP